MADIKYPEGKYKVITVGPSETFEFDDRDNPGQKVQMISYQLQFDGVPEWVKLSQIPKTPAPAVNDELEGHIEDTGKYGMKFVKKRGQGGGGGWGGKRDNTGAHYNAAVAVAADIVLGYYTLQGTKPKDINEVLERVKDLSPVVKKMVDEMAGNEKVDLNAPAENAEAEKPNDKVVIDDIDEKELKW